MKTQTARTGMTFHFNDRNDDDHLYVVSSDTNKPDVVIMNMTTVRRFSDMSCVFNPGEHPFVNRPTCIAYDKTELIQTAVLNKKLSTGDARAREPLSSELMLRLWEGAARSRNLPLKFRQILAEQSLVPNV